MQAKILKLFVTFFVLFSLQGFSQTTEKSNHPLLDKYYPRQQNADTSKTITTQTKAVHETNQVSKAKPVPAVTDKPAIDKSNITSVPLSETKPISETKPTPAVADSTAINKPTNSTIPVPETKKAPAQPSATPYMDTRLGSSSPLYDTWEKNKNGAGSVTTSPKG